MIGWLASLAGLALVAATAVSFASHWRLALFDHFRPQLGVAALVLVPLVVAADAPQGTAVALVLLGVAALNFCLVGRAVLHVRPAVADAAPRLSLAFANLFLYNRQYRRAVDWVRAEKPDLFVACEAYGAWPQELGVLAELYPFATREPFGDLMIFSRWPSVRTDHVLKGWNGNAVLLEIDSSWGPLNVIALHTMVAWHEQPEPGSYKLIADVTELIANRPGDLIVAGDFNATPWSRPMRRLVERTALAFGPGSWCGSFPAWLPSWMGLPIDLVLARGTWRVAWRRPGRRFGSDHWPVIAEIVRIESGGRPP